MLLASVLNSLTTHVDIQTLIRIAVRNSEFIFSSSRLTPQQLRLTLSPVFARIATAQDDAISQRPQHESADLVAQLERLCRLHSDDLLSREEFDGAKGRLLQSH